MSSLEDDIARGCLENGEAIEAKWGTGWWSEEQRKREHKPEFHCGECPHCHKEAWYVDGKFLECEECGKHKAEFEERAKGNE